MSRRKSSCFVFQVDSALTANVLSNVVGRADPCSVYWRAGTSATLNGVTFRGRHRRREHHEG